MAQLQVKDETHWHTLRAQHVGASEVAALFGQSPFLSKWSLWQYKADRVPPQELNEERLLWGTMLEPVIAAVIADKQDWQIQKVHRYITHPQVKGMAASLDFEIINHENGPGAFEIKNVSGWSFKQSWTLNEAGELMEAPLHYELQLQHQLACTGRQWGAIGVLVDGQKSYALYS